MPKEDGTFKSVSLIEGISTYLVAKEKYAVLPLLGRNFRDNFRLWRPKEILIGSKDLAVEVARIVKRLEPSTPLQITHDPARLGNSLLFWGRDFRVTLHDGTQLFLYSPTQWLPMAKTKALQLYLPAPLFSSLKCGYGVYSSAQKENLITQAKDKGCRFRCSRVVIEGGNCQITRNLQGEPVAIVGETSVTLSMLALEEQGYFNDQHSEILALAKAPPSRKTLQMAIGINHRIKKQGKVPAINLEQVLSDPKIEKPEQGAIREYWETLSAPLTEDEQDLFSEERVVERTDQLLAADIHAKWVLTKRVIAQELRIPEKHVAFLPQLEWHIDMDVTPLPNGEVLVNEIGEVMKTLEAWNRPEDHSGEESFFSIHITRDFERAWRDDQDVDIAEKRAKLVMNSSESPYVQQVYYDVAKKRQSVFAPIENVRRRLIEAIGCRPVPVAGVYEGEGHVFSLNFMNAIVLGQGRSFSYITNGSSSAYAFLQKAFQKSLPPCRFGYIEDSRILLSTYEGGIHCLHWTC